MLQTRRGSSRRWLILIHVLEVGTSVTSASTAHPFRMHGRDVTASAHIRRVLVVVVVEVRSLFGRGPMVARLYHLAHRLVHSASIRSSQRCSLIAQLLASAKCYFCNTVCRGQQTGLTMTATIKNL